MRYLGVLRARLKGIKVGQGVYLSFQGKLDVAKSASVTFSSAVSIFNGYRIEVGEHAVISLGKGVHFREGARLFAGRNAKIIIGDGCYFNHDVSIVAVQDVTIGSESIFGPYCYITDNNHGISKGETIMHQQQESKPIHIGSGVWLGVGATLLLGASVEDGAVVAARAVVTKRVPSAEIWGGIPAKRIGGREKDEAAPR